MRFLTPAAATLVFFVARLCVGFGEGPGTSAAGLAGDPVGRWSADEVSVTIRSADAPRSRRPTRSGVPGSERELLELFRRDGSVHFAGGEVEPVEAPVREFSLEEAGVILVTPPR